MTIQDIKDKYNTANDPKVNLIIELSFKCGEQSQLAADMESSQKLFEEIKAGWKS
jgi:hypothetical protein